MNDPNELLSAVSDELGRRIKALATGVDSGLRSASPALKVLPGFPYTLARLEPEEASEEEEAEPRPFPPIWDTISDGDRRYVRFFLGNASSGDEYPVRMPLDETGRQFFFLRIEATVTATCQCLQTDPVPVWECVDEDVVTDDISVINLEDLPEQQNPTVSTPCGGTVEGYGWGSFYGSPSGSYVVYLPLLCFDFTGGGESVSYLAGEYANFTATNPQYFRIRDFPFLAGDSSRLWFSDGAPYSSINQIGGGDPAALCIANIAAQPLNPGDSPFILRSL